MKNQIVTARRSNDVRQVSRVREAYEEHQECRICYEQFNQNTLNRRRVILNCGHCLCRQCRLSNLYIPRRGEMINQVQTRCPICQGEIVESNEVNRDRTSEVLEEQMERLNQRARMKRKRDEDDEGGPRKRLKMIM